MNWIQRHIAYYNNNPERYWFKRKVWGWGWVPATWQGWVVTLLYIALVGLLLYVTEMYVTEKAIPDDRGSESNFLMFGLPFIMLTALFVFIAYKKGEKPKWQWGLPNDKG